MNDMIETFFARDRQAWRAWLRDHHAEHNEIWLVFLKKRLGEPCVSYDEAVEEAICFGWIDGKLRSMDDRMHVIRFSPRKPGSTWAASNRERVERLTRSGLMTEAGLAAVRAAKKSGAWDREGDPAQYDVVPEDLAAALAAAPGAAENLQAMTVSQRRDYVRWVVRAVRDDTRRRRIAEVTRRAAAGIKPGDPG